MSTKEIYCTELGKMLDMINAIAIENGATPKRSHKYSRMEDILFKLQ